MLNVIYAECRHTECRGAVLTEKVLRYWQKEKKSLGVKNTLFRVFLYLYVGSGGVTKSKIIK